VSAEDATSDQPLVTFPEIEATMLAGLGERKRVKTLKKLRKNLTQMQDADSHSAAAAAAAAAAADDAEEEGSGESIVAADAVLSAAAAVVKPGDNRIAELLSQRVRPEEQGHLWHGQQVRQKTASYMMLFSCGCVLTHTTTTH
jgi:hypothetical protein